MNHKKEEIYLDLSKCTEEEQRILEKLTGFKISYIKRYPYLQIIFSGWNQSDCTHLEGKTEITYPEFIKLFEGGEGETSFKNYIENQRKEFARFVSENYTVDKHLQLRTQIDSLLIAYDKMHNKLNSNQ